MASHSSRSAKVGSSSHGVRKPGVWAPCPGATMTSTGSTLPNNGRVLASGAHITVGPFFVGTRQRTVTTEFSRCGRLTPDWRPSASAIRRVSACRGSDGGVAGEVGGLAQPVAHGVGVHEQGACGRLHRRPALEVRREGLDQGALGLRQRQVDLVDQVSPRVAVSGEHPLGQQVVAVHRARRLGPARRRPMGRQRGARREVGRAEVVGHGADDDRPGSEAVGHHLGRLVRVVDPAQHDDEPFALGGAQGVHAGRAGVAAYLVEDVGLGTPRRHRAQHDGDLAPAGPAERARPREDGLVGLGAQHRVDDQGLEARVPGAADLGGAGVDLGRGEGDLAAVEQHGAVDGVEVLGREELVDVRLHHADAEPDQGHRLLEADHARQRAGCGAEDGRGQRGAGGQAGLAGAEPVDEPPDAGLHDQAHPGALLGGELAEPGHVLLHAGHRRGAERAGGPLQGVGRPAPTRVVGVAGAERGGRHPSSVVKGGRPPFGHDSEPTRLRDWVPCILEQVLVESCTCPSSG